MKFTLLKTIKIAIGTMVAIIIAQLLGLDYYTSAGVIVILSIQDTRKESIKLAFTRIIAFFVAFTVAIIIFKIFNYTVLSFSIFIFIFILIAVRYKLQDGIVVNAVLVSHLLAEQSTSLTSLINEISLMLIGVVIALLFNLYMPSYQKTLNKYQSEIENLFEEIITLMSKSLLEQVVSINEEQLYKKLEITLKKARKHAYRNLNNSLFANDDYYVSYVNMRYQQFRQLKRMREHFKRLFITYSVTLFVANFIDKLSNSIGKMNNALPLLEELQKLRMDFKQIDLPKTREEFENRAMLYQFLNDVEQFLEIKNDFHLKYD